MSHLQEKKIAILGGTGTFERRAVVKVISRSCPDVEKVLVFSRDEIKQLEMMDNFPSKDYPLQDFVLGDIRDHKRLVEVLSSIDVFISTDKEGNPDGVHGESKLEAEKKWIFAHENTGLNFHAIRLGNIEGARGSVFEVFERMEVLSVEAPAQFTPQMKTFRVIVLAKTIAADNKIDITGLRHGDKLHEELGICSSIKITNSKIWG